MPIYGNRQDAIYGNQYFLSLGTVGTCETGRVLIRTPLSHVSKGLRDRHSGVRESHVMLSYVCESLRDRCWSASCSLAHRYKFARLLQRKQSKFSSSANHNSLSLSAHCLFMYFDYISLINGDLVTTTIGIVEVVLHGGGHRGLRKNFSFYFFKYIKFIIARMPRTHKSS